MRKSLLATLITAAATLAVVPAAHADDMYLKIDGVTGETPFQKVQDAVQISSFEWSAENTTTIGAASGGAGAGKTSLKELTITKPVDSTSPVLMQKLGQGAMIPAMELVVRKPGATGPNAVYQRYFFTPAFVTSQTNSGDAEGITETLRFAYGAVQMTNSRQVAASPQPTNVITSWNQVTNNIGIAVPGVPSIGQPTRF